MGSGLPAHVVAEKAECVVFITGMVSTTSGGDLHAIKLAENWSSTRGAAYIIGPRVLKDLLAPNSRVTLVSPRVPFEPLLSSWSFLYPVLCIARAIKYGRSTPKAALVVASSHFLPDVLAALLAGRERRRAAYVHHLIAQAGRRPSVRNALSIAQEAVALIALKYFDALLVGDDRARARIRRRCSRSLVIPSGNGCDVPDIGNVEKDSDLVLYLGRVNRQKGAFDFIEIASVVVGRRPQTRLALVGEGPERARLQELAKQRKLAMTCYGFVDDATKWRLLARASVLLAPSYEEGWGIAIDEALAVGTSVVCYDLPAYSRLGSRVRRVKVGDLSRAADEVCEALGVASRESPQRAAGIEGSQTWPEVLEGEMSMLEQLVVRGNTCSRKINSANHTR